ncbi:endonuclease VII [Mycobacterium phage Halena]|uniref:Endonuclease VII n=2 Tax=Mycobacterium virus Bron TaxID=861047 RepID=E0YPM9_9CAUD|nr:endonuclease VII [Mycobacterium phage LeBron]ADL71087.1 endonuclease VII [Mycobacterium phage LeBron]QBP29907.1 endonuclease VII [Mycobacterium phage Halena]QGJ93145.1 hypothetical protein SEA_ZARIA_98 [Mycobacterium phage Zaria]WMI34717.1 endonuclease VII [Mycobacterium phage Calm]
METTEATTKCRVDACPKLPYCRGYCRAHYARWREGRPVDAPITYKRAGSARDEYGRKHCGSCKQWRPVSDFGTKKSSSDGLAYKCMDCQRLKPITAWYRHGISKERYDELVALGCQACGSMDNLAIDHDHACCPRSNGSCGRCVRGCLCRACNSAFGLLGDDAGRVAALLRYAEGVSGAGQSAQAA